jgi:heat shock protein HslJ
MKHILHKVGAHPLVAKVKKHKHYHHLSKKTRWALEGVLIVSVVSVVFGTLYNKLAFDGVQRNQEISQNDSYERSTISLTCLEGYSIVPVYSKNSKTSDIIELRLLISNAGTSNEYVLFQTPSASGVRFATKDESVVFWEHQGEFSLSLGGRDVSLCKQRKDIASLVKNSTFVLDGIMYPLTQGKALVPIQEGEDFLLQLSFFGEPVIGDIDGDGDDDTAQFMVFNGGGSGSFYYVSVAMQDENEVFIPSNLILLGDRIAPQTLHIADTGVYATYAVRNDGEPFTTPPSKGQSLFITYNKKTKSISSEAKEFVQVFDVSTMSLTGKKWMWQKTIMENKKEITPLKGGIFSISFDQEGYVHFSTDCNVAKGTYSLDGEYLWIKDVMVTEMACQNSQEEEFLTPLKRASRYQFTKEGELKLYFSIKQGVAIFK